MNEHLMFTLAGLGVAAIFCQWLAWWTRLPPILFLLLTGIAAGPGLGLLDADALFGGLLFPFVALSVAIILFEGALTLRIDQIKGLETVVRRMVTTGALVTWMVTATATAWLMDWPWDIAILFGAITVVTGPTVVTPLLRSVRPNARIANILRWEGIVIDPVGVILAVVVFEAIIAGAQGGALMQALTSFFVIVISGAITGAAAGHGLGVALRRHLLPEYLRNVTALAAVCGVYAAAEIIHGESGLVAVTVMGVWLTNMKDTPVEDILDFKESLSLLLISTLFITLASRLDFATLQLLGAPALLVLAAIQFIARPLKTLVSTAGSPLTWRERALIGWIAPRGIVAAAISAMFGLQLETMGRAEGALLAPLVFLVIIGTVTLQSATAGLLARALGVAEPEPKGFLIIGANQVARTLAKALEANGCHAILTDSSWENVSKARMEGSPTFYGNPISEAADRQLDLVGIGRMLALSPHEELNTLATMRYQHEFGRNKVYALSTATQLARGEKHRPAPRHRGYTLFGEDVTYAKLAGLITRGAIMRTTKLTEAFGMEEFKAANPGALPLFAFDPKGRAQVFVAHGVMRPKAGWTIISLGMPQEQLQESGVRELRA